VEAVIGAIYLDAGSDKRGQKEVKKIVNKYWQMRDVPSSKAHHKSCVIS
jgi:dsRNA-specific ribonuclease